MNPVNISEPHNHLST